MTEYKIIESKWVDSHGKISNGQTHYTIMYKAKFLFWNYWKPVMHKVCHASGHEKVVTSFSTLVDAREFADNVIANGIKTNTWVKKVVLKK